MENIQNSAELIDIFNHSFEQILSKYKVYSKNSLTDTQRKSFIYFAVQDTIIENQFKLTECQINKLVQMTVFKITEE